MKHQFRKPITRIFEAILSQEVIDRFFSADHTLHVVNKPAVDGHGIVKHMRRQQQCLNCKCQIRYADAPNAPLCHACAPSGRVTYRRRLRNLQRAQGEYARLWTGCQRCKGSLQQAVQCSAHSAVVQMHART